MISPLSFSTPPLPSTVEKGHGTPERRGRRYQGEVNKERLPLRIAVSDGDRNLGSPASPVGGFTTPSFPHEPEERPHRPTRHQGCCWRRIGQGAVEQGTCGRQRVGLRLEHWNRLLPSPVRGAGRNLSPPPTDRSNGVVLATSPCGVPSLPPAAPCRGAHRYLLYYKPSALRLG